jgi:hypothetical protein
VNPYVSFALAMCAIVFIALFATGYMAVYFNRKAKGDLEAALTPLAEELNGRVELEEARTEGTHRGHITNARVTTIGRGPGRVFETQLIDGAGGASWKWTASWPKEGQTTEAIEPQFESPDPSLEPKIVPAARALTLEHLKGPGWLQFSYDPAAGAITLTTPMRTRRDIPSRSVFQGWLDALAKLADVNRAAQVQA